MYEEGGAAGGDTFPQPAPRYSFVFLVTICSSLERVRRKGMVLSAEGSLVVRPPSKRSMTVGGRGRWDLCMPTDVVRPNEDRTIP